MMIPAVRRCDDGGLVKNGVRVGCGGVGGFE